MAELQPAYTNSIFSFKQKWNYSVRTIAEISEHLQPLKKCIKNVFLLSLFGFNISDKVKRLVALPGRCGGIRIVNPVQRAKGEYIKSRKPKFLTYKNSTGKTHMVTGQFDQTYT